MADKDNDKEEKKAQSGTLTRRLSRRFSKKVLEEEEAPKAPSSPGMSSVSSAGPGAGAAATPTVRRSGSMGGAAGMPPAAEVERQFVLLAKKLRLPLLETRTVDLKWRMVGEFAAAQRTEPGEVARAVRRVAKKLRSTGLLGLHASLCEREAEWLVPFVKEGGAKQLLKAAARAAESAAAEDWALLGDLLRCLKELLAVDEGIEALGSYCSPALFLALDLAEEVAQLDLLAVVTAVVLRSAAGCAAVARAVLERKLLAQQQVQLGTLGRRSRATTADAALVPQRLSWTGLDRLVNLLVGGSDDLLLAAVMAVHAMLMRAGPELRDTLVEALRNADLAPKLDLLIRDSKVRGEREASMTTHVGVFSPLPPGHGAAGADWGAAREEPRVSDQGRGGAGGPAQRQPALHAAQPCRLWQHSRASAEARPQRQGATRPPFGFCSQFARCGCCSKGSFGRWRLSQ